MENLYKYWFYYSFTPRGMMGTVGFKGLKKKKVTKYFTLCMTEVQKSSPDILLEVTLLVS